jgi:hypothetical protein
MTTARSRLSRRGSRSAGASEIGALSTGGDASKKEWLAHIVLGLSGSDPKGDIAGIAVDQFVATVPTLALGSDHP